MFSSYAHHGVAPFADNKKNERYFPSLARKEQIIPIVALENRTAQMKKYIHHSHLSASPLPRLSSKKKKHCYISVSILYVKFEQNSRHPSPVLHAFFSLAHKCNDIYRSMVLYILKTIFQCINEIKETLIFVSSIISS